MEHRGPSLCFCFGFLVDRASFQVPDRHFRPDAGLEDDLDESCGSDVEDELVPEFDDNPGTTRGTMFSRLAENLLPLFGQMWPSDRWPTQTCIRVLRRPFQVIEMQACPRVLALLRRDQDRRHLPALPRLFLHFSTGRYQRCGGPGSPQSLQFA